VVGISRNTSELRKIQNQYSEHLQIIECDLSIDGEIEKTAKQIGTSLPYVDVLINNAGILLNKPFVEINELELSQVYKTNVFVPFLLTQSLIKLISNSDHKHVINISSMGGINGSVKFAGLSAYSSSKGALTILTECLAEELKEANIRFNALAIGAVDTQMLREAFPNYSAQISPSEMATYIINFSTCQPLLFNGKVLQVSCSTP
jgi:NAD(P)-dependent dehydrogenase (short-subunit alcohol dehydrogenase family)